MRKIFCMAMIICLLCGCGTKSPTAEQPNKYITGVWISYLELDGMLAKNFKAEFAKVAENCKAKGISDMFVCVRPFCDSYYPSKLFPMRASTKGYDFDILAYMLDVCHKNDINFHAWINPYRVRTVDGEIANLPDGSPAKKWAGSKNVLISNGIYLNPASSEVRQLGIEGVREIINNYNVDGVHFDDYFYPTTDQNFDKASYDEYVSGTEAPLPLDDWRRANVNALISGVYTAIKFKNKDIAFSVSPAASIKNNFNSHYADIAAWVRNGCVDYIIPQLYFGFDYPDDEFSFDMLLADWILVTKGSNTRLLIGLAVYKINTDAEPDRAEWANGADVIKRQVEMCCQNEAVSGHIYFSYSSMAEHIK